MRSRESAFSAVMFNPEKFAKGESAHASRLLIRDLGSARPCSKMFAMKLGWIGRRSRGRIAMLYYDI
jgi:hypothetical protein